MSSDQPHASRRWSRLVDALSPFRRRSHSSAQRAAPSDVTLSRRARRNRDRRSSPDRTSQSQSSPLLPTSTIHANALPIPSSDDASDDSSTPSPTITGANAHPPMIGNAFPELDAMHDNNELFAVLNRIFDDFQSNSQTEYETHAVYFGRLPQNSSRHRVPFRVQNAYYNPNRRQARHSHIVTELERELRLNIHPPIRIHTTARASTYEPAASDAQIEALPTFVMEKGETRSVQQIFESMKHHTVEHDEEHLDECGGLMTSYTECAICLSDFEPGDEITALPCGHYFHLAGCVREWLRNHARTCPTCRADICVNASKPHGLEPQATNIAAGVGTS